MIFEAFLFNKMKFAEKFQEKANSEQIVAGIIVLIIILILAIFYTFGAISLSWNYNNYVGTSFILKLLYAILVFIFPSLYYPVYAWFLNPIKSLKSRTNTINTRTLTGI